MADAVASSSLQRVAEGALLSEKKRAGDGVTVDILWDVASAYDVCVCACMCVCAFVVFFFFWFLVDCFVRCA